MSKKKHDVPEELLASGFPIRSKDQGFEAQLYVFADADGQQLFRDLGSVSGCQFQPQDRSKDSLDRSLRLELATTYGPQISEELLASGISESAAKTRVSRLNCMSLPMRMASNSSEIWGP